MLPIAAQFARTATEELAHSALPGAPVRSEGEAPARQPASPLARRRLAASLRRAADRLEPVAE
jgi:hypothetical protein